MSKFAFPFGIRFRENGKVEIFPAVEVFILGKKKQGIRTVFHLDSGATISILPASDADVLGINLKQGKKVLARGVFGESLDGYQHSITFQFGALKLKAKVIFIESEFVPRILGREDIFTRFGILFDEATKRTLFLATNTERKMINSLFSQSG